MKLIRWCNRLFHSRSMHRQRRRIAMWLSPLLTPLQVMRLGGIPRVAGAATNEVFKPGWNLSVVCTHPAAPDSGDPVRYGQLTGIAETDEGDGGNSATETSVYFGPGVYNMLVDDDGGAGIVVGDPIFYHDTGTGTPATSLNNTSTGADAYFGVALEAVSAGATSTIQVLHVPIGSNLALVSSGLANVRVAEIDLTSAQIKALNATPVTIVAAPGANLAIVPIMVSLVFNYGGTNVFTETADDLSIGYAGGAEIMEIESTGLIDQTNDEWRAITFSHAESFIPEENVAVEITNLDGEIAGNAGGDNTARVRLLYTIVDTDL